MAKTQGQFAVQKLIVTQVCERIITRNQQNRDRLFNEAVEKVMRRRWFFKPKDRADAERIVHEEAAESFGAKWQFYGWGTRGQAEELLAACEVCCEGVVFLSTKEAAFIKEWSKA